MKTSPCPSGSPPGPRRSRNPATWAYSKNTSLNRGAVFSPSTTIEPMLSGITTGNTPPKYSHAASNPAITSSVVWVNVGHTNRWRLKHAVKISAQHTRLRAPSTIKPNRPKSTCNSYVEPANMRRVGNGCLFGASCRDVSAGYSQVLDEGEQAVGWPVSPSACAEGRSAGDCFLFEGEVGVEVDAVGGADVFVAEDERDGGRVDLVA